ncbi:MAG TPA: response regulator transcription factor [Anaerovoracaceae bacterium]|nr:response regulator transcription factor [Anaerovoracaceae bacterium]
MNIIIIDDDILVTTSLKTILESDNDINIVGIGNDGTDAISLYKDLNPDICVMDIRMKNINGIEASKEILKHDKDAKILLLTTFQDDEYIIGALKIGVKGYLIKQDYESLSSSIKAVQNGQSVFGKDVTFKLPELIKKSQSFDYESVGLSSREYEVLKLVADGLNNKEIAKKLYLSEGTVRNYISNILEKLQLRNRTQLAVYYYQNN